MINTKALAYNISIAKQKKKQRNNHKCEYYK